MSPAGDSRLRCISKYIILQSVLREISLAPAMTVVAANRYYCYYYYCNHHRRRYWNSSQPLSGGAINIQPKRSLRREIRSRIKFRVRVLIFDHPRTTHTPALTLGVCVGIDDGPDSGRVQFPSCRRTRSVLYNNVTAGRVRMYRRVLYNVIHKIVLPVASRHRPRRGHSALMGPEHLKTLTARTPGRTSVM